MLAQLIIGLLTEAPMVAEDVFKVLSEIHSKDSTGAKIAAVSSSIATIAEQAAKVAGRS